MDEAADARAAVAERVRLWATARGDVLGLLVVGSYARGDTRPDSDVDLVLLTTDEARYADGRWAAELSLGAPALMRSWGAVTEYRFLTASGLEVEVDIGGPDWARLDPVDPGTQGVVRDGARVLYDPHGVLAALLQACAV